MTLEKTGEWHLASGTWLVQDLADRNHGPQLVRTRLGHDISPELQAADIASLMQLRAAPGYPASYPPEFQHSPATGAPLPAPANVARPWIPPSGAKAVRDVTQGDVVGLRQTAAVLHLQNKASYHAES